MSNPISFNQWLSLQTTNPDGRIAALAKAWDTRRGRITAQTVAVRSEKLGLGTLAGVVAYTAYLEATGALTAPTADAPIPYALTESGAI